jgi:hypothetical protein
VLQAPVPSERHGDFHALIGARRARRKEARKAEAEEIRLVPIEHLRPTQMAVGMRAVTYKRRKLECAIGSRKRIEKLLGKRPIPAVSGPGGELFIVDHHHFGLALWQAEIQVAYARIIDDLSDVGTEQFWTRMEAVGRLYPFDENGERVAPSRLPTWLYALRHDPYRDLAWAAREDGGFAKASTPYAEFRWADFLRARIPLNLLRRDWEAATDRAVKLCHSRAAAHMPGYVGD